MSDSAALVLLWGAASIAFLHTLIGVDHYLPFIVIGKARRWPARKTLGLTALCGVGHVTGSVLLGLIGVALGVAVQKLEFVESLRGSVAAWGLISFGLIYAAVSLLRSARGHRHSHVHAHADGTLHHHDHDHQASHAHAHDVIDRQGLTRWTLFILFVFGPCEALIPMFMVPAYEHNWALVVAVAGVFSAVTIATMLATVAIGLYGFSLLPMRVLDRHANTLAGLAIAGSGLGIQLLGI
jgi:nickel/cobalt exporter